MYVKSKHILGFVARYKSIRMRNFEISLDRSHLTGVELLTDIDKFPCSK